MRSYRRGRKMQFFGLGGLLCLVMGLVALEHKGNYFESFLSQAGINHFTWDGIMSNSLALLSLQIVLVLIVVRILGYASSRFRQPLVVAEILAGIVLGPSILGTILPEWHLLIFPEWSKDNLEIVSQFGLILFMFVIGMELDLKVLNHIGRPSRAISWGSLVISCLVGVVISTYLYPKYAPFGVSFISFAAIISMSISVTAYTLLTRTIQERRLSKSPLGHLALTTSAIDSFTVWNVLALVIILVKAGKMANAVFPIVFGVLYICLMFFGVRPLLARIGSVYSSRELFTKKTMGVVVLVLLGSTYISEIVGIHALYGAFLAGLIMPENFSFKKILIDKIEDISVVLFLPLFFLFVGLRTDLQLLNKDNLWLVFGGVLVLSILGKFGGGVLMASIFNQPLKDAAFVGILLNMKGLMTLIVLNVGLDLGIVTPEVFTLFVLVAVCSTVVISPLLNFLSKKGNDDKETKGQLKTKKSFDILISFGVPKMGSTLVRLADQLTLNRGIKVEITALHITPSAEVKPYEAILFEKEGFQPIKSMAQLLGLKINSIYRNTPEVGKGIVETVRKGNYDLVLVGGARSIFNGRSTGGVLKSLLDEAKVPVGILVDRGFVLAESVLVMLGDESDMFLLKYAHHFLVGSKSRITLLKMGEGNSIDMGDKELPYVNLVREFKEIIEHRIPDRSLLNHFSLVLISLSFWNHLNKMNAQWLDDAPSLLILKDPAIIEE